jgi:hypothetical protein
MNGIIWERSLAEATDLQSNLLSPELAETPFDSAASDLVASLACPHLESNLEHVVRGAAFHSCGSMTYA